MDKPRNKIVLFLALTFLFSAITWVPQLREGQIGLPWIVMTMWSPALAAIITRLVTQRNLRGQGWVPRDWRIMLFAYVLPIAYAAPVYLLANSIGLARFEPQRWAVSEGMTPTVGLFAIATIGLLSSLVTATGEEIGWRGLLVPELAKVTSFGRLVLISGAIWAVWHMPLMIGGDYRGSGTPLAYSLVCFAAMVIALACVMAWITLKSGSLWPAAMLHASHNLFVQGVFDSAFRGPQANWVTGEFGIGLVITIAITALILLRKAPVTPTQEFAS